MPRYASLIYNGYWWSPSARCCRRMIDASQARVNGWVRLKLYKGNVIVVGRDSKTTRCSIRTSPPSRTTRGAYNQKDAAGFIKLNALRMRIAANLQRKRPGILCVGPSRFCAARHPIGYPQPMVIRLALPPAAAVLTESVRSLYSRSSENVASAATPGRGGACR